MLRQLNYVGAVLSYAWPSVSFLGHYCGSPLIQVNAMCVLTRVINILNAE